MSAKSVGYRRRLGKSRNLTTADDIGEVDSLLTKKLIDDRPFEPVGTVTEHSTELLPTAKEPGAR